MADHRGTRILALLPWSLSVCAGLIANENAWHDGRNHHTRQTIHRGFTRRRPGDADTPCRIWLPQPCCHTPEGPLPFVLLPLPKRRGFIPMPGMQLGYCRSISDYVRCAASLGKFLLRRGKPVIILDANGPVAGLVGIYTELRGRKYFKGPLRPRLGDLADTELAIYGL